MELLKRKDISLRKRIDGIARDIKEHEANISNLNMLTHHYIHPKYKDRQTDL